MRAWFRLALAFALGLGIGALGGLLGLGGAELRLPFLLYTFHLAPLEGVIVNKVISFLVVGVSLPARLGTVPWPEVVQGLERALALLLGSVLGAWISAGWARRVPADTLRRTLGFLLILIAFLLASEFVLGGFPSLSLPLSLLYPLAFIMGLGIGGVAAVMGVAGGELLIPALLFLYQVSPKLAGSVSLLISLPTMLTALAQYSQDRTFGVLWRQRALVLSLGLGSLLGGFLGGGFLLARAAEGTLLLLLSLLLLFSALKLLRH